MARIEVLKHLRCVGAAEEMFDAGADLAVGGIEIFLPGRQLAALTTDCLSTLLAMFPTGRGLNSTRPMWT